MKRILLITAASSEVGLHYIQTYHSAYTKIIGQYRTKSKGLEQLKKELGERLILVQGDLKKEEEIQRITNEIKEAGWVPDTFLHLPSLKYELLKFHKIPYERFQEQLQVQLNSAVLLLQSFLPIMAKKEYGRIVFLLSSVIGENSTKYLGDYTIAKYALLGLMKAISAEYAEKKITINGISPGMMETKLLSETADFVLQKNASDNPQKRNAKISDILPMIHYLLSEESGFITGQNLKITGGQ